MYCSFRRLSLLFIPVILAAAPAALGADVQLVDGENALKADYEKWATVWNKLEVGDPVADPADNQHVQAIASAARWATYRVDWGLEKEPGKLNEVFQEFTNNLQTLAGAKDKGQKASELYVKQVIARAMDVETQSQKAASRLNAARLLARLPMQNKDAETRDDVLARLAGANQGDLADAYAAIIKDPTQNDGARYWAFRGLRLLLALPQAMPPTLPRDKEEAALGAVVKFLQDRNKPFPPGASDDEIDGFRMLRTEALAALAQGRYPTLADKSRPTFVLLKTAARDGVAPEPGLAERVEAAVGVARAQPAFDKDYQPDYAAHQLGLFVADFGAAYGLEKQTNPGGPETLPWRVDASRLIEALEVMKAQTKNAHVAFVADACSDLLKKVEKGLDINASDLEQALAGQASPGQSLYKGAAEATVKQANRKDEGPAEKPEPKKDK